MDNEQLGNEEESWIGVRLDPAALASTPAVAGYKTRGRGAVSNSSGRFEAESREAFDDGWDNDELPVMKTEVNYESPKTIITKNQSPDISFDRSINAYRGCEHGCSYCFARPCLLYTSPSPRDKRQSRMPSSA